MFYFTVVALTKLPRSTSMPMSSSTTDIHVSASQSFSLFFVSIVIRPSRPSRIPVLYVFSKAPLDVSDAAESLLKTAYKEASVSQAVPDSPHFILIPDVAYAHLAGESELNLINSA